ncbi:MAG: glycosyl hydrolase family 18 protein [bacterium]|nr:glycosyl hydrolase family 18 protein [bacterium]
MKKLYFSLAVFVLGCVSFLPSAHAATKLEISGWIPYWRKATGTAEAISRLDTFKEINPFGYSVKNNGTLADTAKLDEEPWVSLIVAARAKKVRVIPTVMWSDGAAIHRILSNSKTRIALEDEIAALVKEKGFDGIDIDFEGKKAETKNYFSTFLKGLYQRMGKKWVMCTIEARTPLDSRYDTIPKDIRYANDFAAINKYCDRVRLMTYDQGSIDLRLNEAAPGPYVPVADPKWVEKVVRLVSKTISKNKIVIGVATYGYEYEVKPLAQGYRYNLLWAFNPRYALELAGTLGITPERNLAGELSFSYASSSPPISAAASAAVATDTALSNNVPIATTTFSSSATTSVATVPFHILWWSDAVAIKDKVALAKKLGVRGVAVFKIDGGADPGIWEALR